VAGESAAALEARGVASGVVGSGVAGAVLMVSRAYESTPQTLGPYGGLGARRLEMRW